MNMPGVVPNSDKYLGHDDPDGNQLWRVTVMRDQGADYVRVLKKNGFQSALFDFNRDKYNENMKLLAKLQTD